MRNKKKIELLQLEVDYLHKNINILNDAVQYILGLLENKDSVKTNLDSGKWYKTP